MTDDDAATWANAPTARWWSALDDGRLQCDLCPRRCRLHPSQRGFCFVRARDGDRMVLTTYGRSSCLLYTSDAADDLLCVDLGGRRIIKKKKKNYRININE